MNPATRVMHVVELRAHGGPEVLRLAQRPLPEPVANEVRVRAQAIGVGSADTLIRNGIYAWMPPLPAVPGNELAGVVDALGPGVSGLAIGRRVLVSSRELPNRRGVSLLLDPYARPGTGHPPRLDAARDRPYGRRAAAPAQPDAHPAR